MDSTVPLRANELLAITAMALSDYRPIRFYDGDYAPWLARLAGQHGVYVIRTRRTKRKAPLVLYVGESHTHRLRETLQRHFQQWNGQTSGPTFKAEETVVAVQVFDLGDEAIQRQNELIRRLRPVHNHVPEPSADPLPKPKRKSRQDQAFDELAAFFDEVSA